MILRVLTTKGRGRCEGVCARDGFVVVIAAAGFPVAPIARKPEATDATAFDGACVPRALAAATALRGNPLR